MHITVVVILEFGDIYTSICCRCLRTPRVVNLRFVNLQRNPPTEFMDQPPVLVRGEAIEQIGPSHLKELVVAFQTHEI